MYRCSRALTPLTRGLNSISHQPSRSYLVLSPFSRRSWHPLAVVEDTMREMDREFRQLDSIFRRDTFPEWEDTPIVTLANKSEIVKDGDKDIYTLHVRMGQNFPPENIKVSLKDRSMTIEAKYEKKSDDGTSRVYQEVMRQFTLPDNVDLNEVKSSLTTEGILTIEAPIPPRTEEAVKPKEIPIQKE